MNRIFNVKNSKNKKAQESTLVFIIICLVIAVILISAWFVWSRAIKKKSDVEVCHLSVLGKSYTKAGTKSPLEIECPRNLITFYNNRVISKTLGKETEKQVYVKRVKTDRFNELTQDIVFQVFAEELKDCWYKMGEAKYIPFDQAAFVKASHICLLCSEFSFDNELKDEEIIYEGLSEYLNNTNIPGTETSYGDYLTIEVKELQKAGGYEKVVETGRRESALIGLDEFSTEKTYYLIYSAFTPALLLQLNFEISLTSPREEEPLGVLFLIDADDISSIKCNMLYN